MSDTNTVTCSFTLNRDLYNRYKSIIVRGGGNVKGDLVRYMENVITESEVPNSETLEALSEVKSMKEDPSLGKSYTDIDKMMEDLLK